MRPSTLLTFTAVTITKLVTASPLAFPQPRLSPDSTLNPFDLVTRNDGNDEAPDGTLYPSPSWDHDLSDLGDLQPTANHKLYYTETGQVGEYLLFGIQSMEDELLLGVYKQVVAANGSAPVDGDGFTYTTILDDQSSYAVLGDEMGVLRFADKEEAKSLPWADYDGNVESDAQDRILHCYPAQM